MEVPVTFRAYRPLPGGVTVTPEVFLGSTQGFADVEVAPPEIHVPVGTPRTETRVVSVTVKRYDYKKRVAETGIPGKALFKVRLWARAEGGCINRGATNILLSLLPSEGAGATQSRP